MLPGVLRLDDFFVFFFESEVTDVMVRVMSHVRDVRSTPLASKPVALRSAARRVTGQNAAAAVLVGAVASMLRLSTGAGDLHRDFFCVIPLCVCKLLSSVC